jgi:hypothetical protein
MITTGYRSLFAKVMVIVGSILILVGALDPLEGSILIFIGSGLAALGTFLGRAEPRLIRYRTLVFCLIAAGLAAMWGLTAKGGFGGKTGLSMWWGLLILPYLIGYPMAIGGPGNPRWLTCLGIGVGLWYLVLGGMVFSHPSKESSAVILILLATIGLAIIASCITRLVTATRHLNKPNPASPVAE